MLVPFATGWDETSNVQHRDAFFEVGCVIRSQVDQKKGLSFCHRAQGEVPLCRAELPIEPSAGADYLMMLPSLWMLHGL